MKVCYINNKPKAVCEQYKIKNKQSKLIEEFKMQHPNNDLIIVKDWWSDKTN